MFTLSTLALASFGVAAVLIVSIVCGYSLCMRGQKHRVGVADHSFKIDLDSEPHSKRTVEAHDTRAPPSG